MKKRSYIFLLIGILFVSFPRETHAIPPPDVLSQIGSSFAQIVGLVTVFASIVFSFVIRYAKRMRVFMKRRLSVFLLLICVTMFALSIVYGVYEVRRSESERISREEVAQRIVDAREAYDTIENPEVFSVFYEKHQELPLTISYEAFATLPSDIFVLDAREDEEYDIGFYPGSTHIRFADILAGAWQELPSDRIVYVLCWSGIRGSEVVSFLREKGIVAQALEEGASEWVARGGMWEGEIAFSHVYRDERYSMLFSREETRAFQDAGVVLVDVRSQDKYGVSHILGSVHISSLFTPTRELEVLLDQIPRGSRVITVCDDFVSCFDTKIVGIKLEKRGNVFLGRHTLSLDSL